MLDTIFSTAINYFSILISLFPTANFDIVNQISEFMNTFRSGLSFMGVFFPISILLWAMGLILTIETALFSFKAYRWLASNLTLGIFK